jgi:ribosomal protein S11
MNKIGEFELGKYSGGKTAFLIYYRGFTNITMTLIDMNSKVITHKTSGQSEVGRFSRAKKSPQAIEKIIFKLNSTFKKYNLMALHVIIKRRVP